MEALEVVNKLIGQLKAQEEEDSVRAGATLEEKAKSVARVDELLRHAIEVNLPGTGSFHEEYIQRLRRTLASSINEQEYGEVTYAPI